MKRLISFLFVLSLVAAPLAAAAQPAGVPDVGPTADVVAPADAGPTADVPADKDAGVTDVAEPEPTPEPPKPPEDLTEALETGGAMIEAAKNGNWVLFSGLLIMLLIFILDKVVKLKEKVSAAAVPWVAAALGIASSIAVQLVSGIPWGQALFQGFTAGATAVGLWELLGKVIFKKKEA